MPINNTDSSTIQQNLTNVNTTEALARSALDSIILEVDAIQSKFFQTGTTATSDLNNDIIEKNAIDTTNAGTAGQVLAVDTNNTANMTWVSVSLDDLSGTVSTNQIENDAVTLGTKTTGNYVQTIANASNGVMEVTGSGSESADVTVNLSYQLSADSAVTYSAGVPTSGSFNGKKFLFVY